MDELYRFNKYREFLKEIFPNAGQLRGRRRQLAKILNCQTSFISLVLTERAHFNEDMIFSITKFLKLNTTDTEYLLYLYHHERAATPDLRAHYEKKRNEILNHRTQISTRVSEVSQISLETQAQYYSNWIYSAIHIALLNPASRTIESLSQKFRLTESIVSETLELLTQWNFVMKTTMGYEPGTNRLHLNPSSPFLVQHHRNWLIEAVRAVGDKNSNDLSYSGALSMSESDFPAVKELLLISIGSIEKKIKKSPDEKTVGITINLFGY